MNGNDRGPGSTRPGATRQVLATVEDVREAMVEVARCATRRLAIFVQDLEAEIFDDAEFLDSVKRLCLAGHRAQIRVLVSSHRGTLRDGNRFVYLGRRMSSAFEFRRVHEDFRERQETFMIADESALVFRADASRWEGVADTAGPVIARRYLSRFDEMWNASRPAPDFRQLRI